MKALVAVASRHGATREIGEVIAQALTENGVSCEVRAAEDVHDLQGFDAVIVGSPIYTGRWLPEARELVEHLADQLRQRQVWLFSSGLSDAPAKASNRPAETLERVAATGAVGHRHFPGRLDLSVLSFPERAIIAAARGKQGDRRDMDAVRAWADQIAVDVRSAASA